MHAIIQPEGDAGPDGDGELLERDERPSQLGWCDLSLIQRDHHAEHADPDAPDDTAGEEHPRVLGAGLETGAQGEDDHGHQHAVLAGDAVGEVPVEEGAGPRAQLERGHQPALEPGLGEGREMGLEVLHDEDGAHHALVVAVHHAPERGEEAGHEDIGVMEHAYDAMLFVLVGASDDGLTVEGGFDHHGDGEPVGGRGTAVSGWDERGSPE